MSAPSSYNYQWYSNGVLISGANTQNYVIQSTDIGHSLTCIVTAVNPTASVSVTTPATSVITS